jgi:hypothetical protein
MSCLSPLQSFAQQRVDLRNTYERLLMVVPMVGAGTYADPRRPLYAPLPPARGVAPSRDGIIAFSYQISDDGRFALAEFVARDRAGFKQILSDQRADVKLFEKGKAKRADIEAEFRKHKKNFDFDRFGARVP